MFAPPLESNLVDRTFVNLYGALYTAHGLDVEVGWALGLRAAAGTL